MEKKQHVYALQGPPIPIIPYTLKKHLWQAGVAADRLVAGVLAVLVAVTHPAQGDARRCKYAFMNFNSI